MENIFEDLLLDNLNLANAGLEKNLKETGDYIQNDLIYCGQCHTPKQARYSSPELNPFIAPVMCKCEQEKENALKYARLQAEIEKHRQICFQGFQELINARFSNDDGKNNPDVMQLIRFYADDFQNELHEGEGLLLYGNVGSGKSFAAACIANHLIEKNYSCLMTSFPRIMSELWSASNKQAYLDDVNHYQLLIIDDFDVERKTGYANEIVTGVLNARYNSGKPLIITTNLTPQEMQDNTDKSQKRNISRILGKCIPVEFTGDDRRKSNISMNAQNFYKRFQSAALS